MDLKRFWDVIAFCCPHGADSREWYRSLVKTISSLPSLDMVRFDRRFGELTDALYTVNHWGAAYLINGGASDDGFYYFRCWLVGMGKTVYEAALAGPDSLADVVDPSEEYEAEIYGVAWQAWQRSGRPEEEFEKLRKSMSSRKQGKLKGRNWDFDNNAAMRKHLPRLAAMYLGGEEA